MQVDPKSLDKAVGDMLAEFAENYRGKGWTPGPLTFEVWRDRLGDMTPDEVRSATALWTSSNKWPPTVADIRQLVPRFCRCGKCWPCRHRAVKRAGRSGPGADLDSGETLDEQRRRFFGRPAARPALNPAPKAQPRALEGR